MKLMHTSDWHLGLDFYGQDLIADQRHMIESIVRIAKEEKVTQQKVFLIRMLASNVNSCLPMVTDDAVRAELETLADNIRFSDPMSHQALAVVEGELANTIDEIALKLTEGNQDVSSLIKKAEMQLSRRNSQCAMLK